MTTTKKRKTWRQKLTKTQLGHVKESTEFNTLAEVKRNIQHQRENNTHCFECQQIADRLGL